MRFDDRLATILGRNGAPGTGSAATWAQIADLLAQDGSAMPPTIAARGLAALSLLRADVSIAARATAARAIAGRCRFAPLAVLLASEPAPVVTAFFDRVTLADHDWTAIVADIGPLARSRLRHRTDISPLLGDLLARMGSTDFAIASAAQPIPTTGQAAATAAPSPAQPPPAADPPAENDSEIARLVQRIESWRSRRPVEDAPVAALAHDDAMAIQFVTDGDGLVRAIDGVPRAAFVGMSLAHVAEPGSAGVDAGVARAFAKRSHIRQGRLGVSAGSPWSGVWAIDAQPVFDRSSGRFTGYAGTLSLADPHTSLTPDLRSSERTDTVRQMLHELRSPLNAMSGFAQLIDGQYFGPVPTPYHRLNRVILRDTQQLARGIEDLALAAELESGSYTAIDATSPALSVMEAFASRHPDVRLDPFDPHLLLPMDQSQCVLLLDQMARALRGDDEAPLRLRLADQADAGRCTLEMRVDAADEERAYDASRAANRSLAMQLAQCHDMALEFVGDSASLNMAVTRQAAEAAEAAV